MSECVCVCACMYDTPAVIVADGCLAVDGLELFACIYIYTYIYIYI